MLKVPEHPYKATDSLYKSRKFIVAIIAIILFTILTIISQWCIVLSTSLSIYRDGLLGILAIYYGGNVGNKYIVGKVLKTSTHKKKIINNKGDK